MAVEPTRRRIVWLAGGAGAGLLVGCARSQPAGAGATGESAELEVSPGEDLMREHGVLSRVLLVYEECIRRLRGKQPLPAAVVSETAGIVRRFIEDYHERLEEEFLFTRFEQAARLTDLVAVLRRQHEAGRGLTDTVLRVAASPDLGGSQGRDDLDRVLAAFIRMYRPHEAREDTVLFPAFREIVPAAEFAELGEQFEEREHRLFGAGGF